MFTRDSLKDLIAEETGLSKVKSRELWDKLEGAMTEALVKGDKVSLVGFCNLEAEAKEERQGRNPQTGEPMTIPAHRRIKFKAGKRLKEAINN